MGKPRRLTYGRSRWHGPFCVRGACEGTVSGWINPRTCVFKLNASSVYPRAIDPRHLGASLGPSWTQSGLYTVQKELAFDDCGARRRLVFMEVVGMATRTRLLYHDGSKLCWRNCLEPVPEAALVGLCGEPMGRSLALASGNCSGNNEGAALDIQEKNWSPFSYSGRVHFVYSLKPFRVCAVDMKDWQTGSPLPCSICHTVPAVQPGDLMTLNTRLHKGLVATKDALDTLQWHMNGVPMTLLPDDVGAAYLGVAHVFGGSRSSSGKWVRRYTSFLFKMSSTMPFRILDLSAPLPLVSQPSTAPYWADRPADDVEVSFVSGLVVEKGQDGKVSDLVLSYGSGDDESRLLRLPLTEALSLFEADSREHEEGLRHLVEGNSARWQFATGLTLFCFSVVVPGTHQVEVLQEHLKEGLLSGCDEYGVYSNVTNGELLNDSSVPGGQAVEGPISVATGGLWGNALNTPVFLAVWREILRSGVYQQCDWTVKVDPDTVFLPQRLRSLLQEYPLAGPLLLLNKVPGPPDFSGLNGPIEVFSREAIQAYASDPALCEQLVLPGTAYMHEDWYLERCMGLIGVRAVHEPYLLNQNGIDECMYSFPAAHHPFKDPATFKMCLNHQRAHVPHEIALSELLPSHLIELGRDLFGSESALLRTVRRSVSFRASMAGVTMTLRMDPADSARQRLQIEAESDPHGIGVLQDKRPLHAKTEHNLSTTGAERWINVVDIGGNLGTFSIAAFKQDPHLTRVLVVEPIPSSYFFLRWNLWLNGVPEIDEASLGSSDCATPGVLALRRAIASAEGGEAILCHSAASSTKARKEARNCTEHVTAPSFTLGQLLRMLGQESVALLKLDCEGCERHSLPVLALPQVRARIGRLAGELHGDCTLERSLEDIACRYEAGRFLTVNECAITRRLRCQLAVHV